MRNVTVMSSEGLLSLILNFANLRLVIAKALKSTRVGSCWNRNTFVLIVPVPDTRVKKHCSLTLPNRVQRSSRASYSAIV